MTRSHRGATFAVVAFLGLVSPSIADRWQLARQEVRDKRIACDVQQEVMDMCRGWDSFSDEELTRFYFEMTGQQIAIR